MVSIRGWIKFWQTKWVGRMHELLPSATRIAVLVNPEDRMNVVDMITDVQGAATALGLQVEVLYASTRKRGSHSAGQKGRGQYIIVEVQGRREDDRRAVRCAHCQPGAR
jgi:hypothetical protein